jgi:UDP-N-acetylglucosamine 1-carboxyvinyltransferase
MFGGAVCMNKIIVASSPCLHGTVCASGSKNASLPILASALLSEEEIILEDIPKLKDIKAMCDILESIGAEISRYKNTVKITARQIDPLAPPYELVSQLRGSFLLAGPLLTRFGKVKISLPGGCRIGTRPVDLHLKGFALMGAEIEQGHGFVEANCSRLHGAKIYLDVPSVGATENIMMAATLAEGETIIENASVEPEVEDLAKCLQSMGAQIDGSGTDTITIRGVEKLAGARHKVIPDRIEIGTYMIAAALTRGNITVENVIHEHINPTTAKLKEMGIEIIEYENAIDIRAGEIMKATSVKTMPFPGFPTDMQAPFMSLMSVVPGTSMIVETIYENRFMHVAELNRMGANIKTEGRTAIVEGVSNLTGAKVNATDLRSGAALILAGLVGKGDTEIGEIGHIERGYYNIVEKLQGLGAKIEKK